MRLYCAGKPLFGLLLATHLSEPEWDQPLAPLLGTEDRWSGATIWELASHRAGLPGGPAALLSALPRKRRESLVTQVVPSQPRGTVDYDQLLGWELVRLALEARSGVALHELTDTLTDALGIHGLHVGGPAEHWHHLHENGAVLPLVGEVTLSAPWHDNAGIGWTGSTRGLASLGQALLADHGPPISAWRERALRCDPHHDPSLERWCRLGGAFMIGLSDHEFGAGWSPGSLGHAGYQGAMWFGADPARHLVVAVNHHHIIDADRAVLGRRPAVMAAIAAALQVGEGPYAPT
jgi:CubicO group peptidase (beta-lactamase class C family)